MADDPASATVRAGQPEALRAIMRRLARQPQPPWLHAEAARRMAERLPLIRSSPKTVLDWCSRTGASGSLLRRAYPKANLVQVEDPAVLQEPAAARLTPRWWPPLRRAAGTATPTSPDSVTAGSAELLWSNMMLHWVGDPLAQFRQWHAALAVDGFLMFSTLGPGSLTGLRSVYARLGWPAPHAPFIDMHDLGDMLVQAGFADPVMDQESLVLTWPDADALLRELRTLGGNADPRRHPGLRTPRWRDRLGQALEALRGADGRLRMEFELVYGHAFRGAPRPRVAEQTAVPLDEMRAMMRAGRGGAGPR
jgi:malonyl-CoA O-methyltransferase